MGADGSKLTGLGSNGDAISFLSGLVNEFTLFQSAVVVSAHLTTCPSPTHYLSLLSARRLAVVFYRHGHSPVRRRGGNGARQSHIATTTLHHFLRRDDHDNDTDPYVAQCAPYPACQQAAKDDCTSPRSVSGLHLRRCPRSRSSRRTVSHLSRSTKGLSSPSSHHPGTRFSVTPRSSSSSFQKDVSASRSSQMVCCCPQLGLTPAANSKS